MQVLSARRPTDSRKGLNFLERGLAAKRKLEKTRTIDGADLMDLCNLQAVVNDVSRHRTRGWFAEQAITLRKNLWAYVSGNKGREYGRVVTSRDSFYATEKAAKAVLKMIDRCKTLTPRQRQVMELTYYRGLSRRQVAEGLGVSVRAVQVHVEKGLKKLREAMQQ